MCSHSTAQRCADVSGFDILLLSYFLSSPAGCALRVSCHSVLHSLLQTISPAWITVSLWTGSLLSCCPPAASSPQRSHSILPSSALVQNPLISFHSHSSIKCKVLLWRTHFTWSDFCLPFHLPLFTFSSHSRHTCLHSVPWTHQSCSYLKLDLTVLFAWVLFHHILKST